MEAQKPHKLHAFLGGVGDESPTAFLGGVGDKSPTAFPGSARDKSLAESPAAEVDFLSNM